MDPLFRNQTLVLGHNVKVGKDGKLHGVETNRDDVKTQEGWTRKRFTGEPKNALSAITPALEAQLATLQSSHPHNRHPADGHLEGGLTSLLVRELLDENEPERRGYLLTSDLEGAHGISVDPACPKMSEYLKLSNDDGKPREEAIRPTVKLIGNAKCLAVETFRNGIPNEEGLDELAKMQGAVVYNFTNWRNDEPSFPHRPNPLPDRKGTARGTTTTRTQGVNTPAPTAPTKKPTNIRNVKVVKQEEAPSSPREIPVAKPASKHASCAEDKGPESQASSKPQKRTEDVTKSNAGGEDIGHGPSSAVTSVGPGSGWTNASPQEVEEQKSYAIEHNIRNYLLYKSMRSARHTEGGTEWSK
ncbi:hypothetical protein PG996_009232 [Apiospora saccharicola]|uniref:Uncharacterized protein n=1 Tax=Apiospora saccharicola TaxID=335842 RepID=A0ABR1UKQ9_9PEZI